MKLKGFKIIVQYVQGTYRPSYMGYFQNILNLNHDILNSRKIG
jgi:hypothetical protein